MSADNKPQFLSQVVDRIETFVGTERRVNVHAVSFSGIQHEHMRIIAQQPEKPEQTELQPGIEVAPEKILG